MENENTPVEKITTRSVGVRFGLYNALIGILLFVIAIVMASNPFSNTWNWIGAGIGIVLIVLAHKQFKDNGDGFMMYGQGVGIGFWIGLISTLVSVPVLYIYIGFIDSSPFELFLREQEDKLIAQGLPDQAIEMSMSWTKNLFWVFAAIGGIVGSVIFALIVSIFTKKSPPEMPI